MYQLFNSRRNRVWVKWCCRCFFSNAILGAGAAFLGPKNDIFERTSCRFRVQISDLPLNASVGAGVAFWVSFSDLF